MKKIRNVFSILLVSVLALFLVSCNKNKDLKLALDQITFDKIKLENDSENKIISDLNLITEVDGIKITWESSNEDVITSEGKVILQDKDIDVVLKAIASKDDKTLKKEFELVVKALDTEKALELALEKINVDPNFEMTAYVYYYDKLEATAEIQIDNDKTYYKEHFEEYIEVKKRSSFEIYKKHGSEWLKETERSPVSEKTKLIFSFTKDMFEYNKENNIYKMNESNYYIVEDFLSESFEKYKVLSVSLKLNVDEIRRIDVSFEISDNIYSLIYTFDNFGNVQIELPNV